MYLTQINPDFDTCRQKALFDAYRAHLFIYSCFPLERKNENPRILFVALPPKNQCSRFLVLSEIIPEIPDGIPAKTIPVPEDFLNASAFHFEVLLNPVIRTSKTGKSVPVKGQLPLLQWFTAHAPKWGFTPDPVTLECFVRESVPLDKKSGTPMRLHQVLFRGTLTVADPELFRASFQNGIGREKAFGFGLLRLSQQFH